MNMTKTCIVICPKQICSQTRKNNHRICLSARPPGAVLAAGRSMRQGLQLLPRLPGRQVLLHRLMEGRRQQRRLSPQDDARRHQRKMDRRRLLQGHGHGIVLSTASSFVFYTYTSSIQIYKIQTYTFNIKGQMYILQYYILF